jgi:acyl-CoA synthetase (NDP forming)
MRELLEPESIAVVGASATPAKSGHILLKNLIDHGFPGRLYPVHQTAAELLGLPAYRSVSQLPETPDVVFIVVPRERVLAVVKQCEARGVRAIVVVSAGFSETGGEGAALEQELREVLKRSGIRAIGPNTVGFANASRKLVASFVPMPRWRDGTVALAGQSGLFAGGLIHELMSRETPPLGIRLSLSFGNKIDLDEVDFLDYASRDPEIRVIGLHLESLKRPREFLELARRVSGKIPVVVLKTGRTEAGARAAASHTAALAIEDRVLSGAFRQANVIRASNVEEFIALLRCFACAPLPAGASVGVLTHSGASGVMACDEISEAGLALACLEKATEERIGALVPHWHRIGNPTDVWLAEGGEPRRALELPLFALLGDPGVDMVLCILLAIPATDFAEVGEVFREARRRYPEKPLHFVLYGGAVKQRWQRTLEGLDIPVETDTRLAIRAMQAMVDYRRRRARASTPWN